MSNKRIRGVAIHRPILVGSTSTPLSLAEKVGAPQDHTHKWTVAVRSAASHPLPSLSTISGLNTAASGLKQGDEVSTMAAAAATASGAGGSSQLASVSNPSTPSGGSISTRGRDQEFDYHRLVGGKDDISHFIKRVQFKLHDTYAQPTRNIDKPPFSVTETGWGEFEIQVKIFFVAEANEKPITLFHHLKLHPWLNTLAPPEPVSIPPTIAAPSSVTVETAEAGAAGSAADSIVNRSIPTTSAEDSADVTMAEAAEPTGSVAAPTSLSVQTAATTAGAPALTDAPATRTAPPVLPPVVHSWQYDEIVFPEPTEAFYEILTAHPPTPLPGASAQAFSDPSAYRSYQSAVEDATSKGGRSSKQPLLPPHPLHAPTGYLFDALSQEAQQAESDRLDLARISAVQELERGRDRLIKAERALKEARNKINALNASVASTAASIDKAELAA